MSNEEIEILDEKITDIRIELSKSVDKVKIDKMLYDLQITIFKLDN